MSRLIWRASRQPNIVEFPASGVFTHQQDAEVDKTLMTSINFSWWRTNQMWLVFQPFILSWIFNFLIKSRKFPRLWCHLSSFPPLGFVLGKFSSSKRRQAVDGKKNPISHGKSGTFLSFVLNFIHYGFIYITLPPHLSGRKHTLLLPSFKVALQPSSPPSTILSWSWNFCKPLGSRHKEEKKVSNSFMSLSSISLARCFSILFVHQLRSAPVGRALSSACN